MDREKKQAKQFLGVLYFSALLIFEAAFTGGTIWHASAHFNGVNAIIGAAAGVVIAAVTYVALRRMPVLDDTIWEVWGKRTPADAVFESFELGAAIYSTVASWAVIGGILAWSVGNQHSLSSVVGTLFFATACMCALNALVVVLAIFLADLWLAVVWAYAGSAAAVEQALVVCAIFLLGTILQAWLDSPEQP